MAGELVWKHLYLTEAVARQCGVDAALVADVGLAALEKAEQTYDPEKGSSFHAYASVILKHEYIRYRRTHIRMSQKEDLNSTSENHEATHRAMRTLAQLGLCRQKDEAPLFTNRDIEALRETLNDEEYALLYAYYVDGKSMQQLADDRGVVRQWIWVQIKKLTERATGNA